MTEKLEKLYCDQCGKPTKDENLKGYIINGKLLCWACASEALRMDKWEEK